MTPLLRNAAIAAGLTLLPAALATAYYAQEQRKSWPERIGDRLRGLVRDDDTPEANLKRIGRRLDTLGEQLDAMTHDAGRRLAETTPQTRMIAGFAALALIPAALAALFPKQRRALTDTVSGYFDHDETEQQIEKELDTLNERLSTLTSDIERHRDSNFDAVTKAAQKKS